jgi:hypothetical protein
MVSSQGIKPIALGALLSLLLGPASAALKWTKGSNVCMAGGDTVKSQAFLGLCLGDATVPTAYFIQESERTVLVKGNTDKDYLVGNFSANTFVAEPSDASGGFFDEIKCCAPSTCCTESTTGECDQICGDKPFTGSYAWVTNSMKFGAEEWDECPTDGACGIVAVGYYLSTSGAVSSNIQSHALKVETDSIWKQHTCLNG